MKNTHGGMLLLVLKVTLFHGCFSRFLNCMNSTKSPNAPHMTCGTLYKRPKNVPSRLGFHLVNERHLTENRVFRLENKGSIFLLRLGGKQLFRTNG